MQAAFSWCGLHRDASGYEELEQGRSAGGIAVGDIAESQERDRDTLGLGGR